MCGDSKEHALVKCVQLKRAQSFSLHRVTSVLARSFEMLKACSCASYVIVCVTPCWLFLSEASVDFVTYIGIKKFTSTVRVDEKIFIIIYGFKLKRPLFVQ